MKPKKKAALYLLVLLVLLNLTFAFTSFAPYGIKNVNDSCHLKNEVSFPIGVAINTDYLRKKPNYRLLVRKEFNSITAENCMKAAALHPQPNVYDWSNADYLVDFAIKNNMRVHGHNLIWHQSLPVWIQKFEGSEKEWEDLLKTHIQTIIAHFKGRVQSWDVVNEAFNDDGTYRKSVWYIHLGKEYIAKSFLYAHQAAPNAKLFYNDYGQEYSQAKRRAILQLLSEFKQRNIPIHGIGLQMHTTCRQKTNNIENAIISAAKTGLLIHISELDVAVNPENDPHLTYENELVKKQAAVYTSVFKAYHSIPLDQRFGITFWNLTDADSWLPKTYKRPDWPLLFDKDYHRKALYQIVLKAIK